ncbi:MAG: phosphotransferase [Steroidobacterales bacterium]
MPDTDVIDAIAALPCWSGAIEIEALKGGLTNRNFRVSDQRRQQFVVRIGRDLPEHGVMRSNELAAARAAYAAGIAPQIVYAGDGLLVSRFVAGSSLTPERVRDARMLERIAALLRRCHRDIPGCFEGSAVMFWVFQIIRGYLRFLTARGGGPDATSLAAFAARAERLERAVGAVDIVFGHNDLLAANLIDDGQRLWLIDWEYAGFNTPLFDLANLATNNELSDALEAALLESYFDGPVAPATRRAFAAMQCASLLRETLWAAVSGLTSKIDFDYRGYGEDYRRRFESRCQQFDRHHG